MYAIYQSGWRLLGVGETVDAALDDARLEEAFLLNAIGEPVDADQYTNYTRLAAPGLEVEGDLYMRRCSLALFEAARDTVPSSLPYHVDAHGVVQKGHV